MRTNFYLGKRKSFHMMDKPKIDDPFVDFYSERAMELSPDFENEIIELNQQSKYFLL